MINFNDYSLAPGQAIDTDTWNEFIRRVSELPLTVDAANKNVGIGTLPDSKAVLNFNGSIRGNHTGGALKIETDYGYITVGPRNGGFAHIETDRPVFYFNKELKVDSGKIGSYNENLSLCTAGTVRLTIKKSNGFVGIGRTNPTQALHVVGKRIRLQKAGSSSKYIDIRTDGNANDITSYGGDLYLNATAGKNVVVSSKLRLRSMSHGDFKNVQWNNSTGILGYDNSSRRFKENIVDLDENFEAILKAKPKTYTRPDNPGRKEIGFIAEDFHDLGMIPLVDYDEDGLPESLRYDKMVTYIIPVLAKQKEKIELLEKEVNKLKKQVYQTNLSVKNQT